MRGVKSLVKAAVFIGASAGLWTAAFAQADPRTPVTLLYYEANGKPLTSVTVSRTNPELLTQAAYMFKIENKATTDLGRLRFTATLTTTAANIGDNGKWSALYIASQSPGVTGSFTDCSPFGQAYLHCEGNVTLPRSSTDANGNLIIPQVTVLLVANTPYSGSSLNATVTAGGYEGNSNTGNGCCENAADPQSLSVQLSQPSSSSSSNEPPYTTYALTFLRGQQSSTLFTGNRATNTTIGDLFSSEFNAPQFDLGTSSPKYTVGEIIESPVTDTTNCRNGNRFKNCYASEITIPQVTYPMPPLSDITSKEICKDTYATPLLTEILRIDSSLIKGNPTPDLTQIQVYYTDSEGRRPVYDCTVTDASNPLPCICSRYQYSRDGQGGTLTYTNSLKGTIELIIKNNKNGRLEFF